MTTLLRIIVLTFALMALTFSAGATPVIVTFNNGGSYTDGSINVGLYNLTIGTGVNARTLLSPCLSDNLHVTNGEQWNANEVGIYDPSDPNLPVMKQIVYLDLQFAPAYLPGGNTNIIAPIQHAIWDLGEMVSGTSAASTTFRDASTISWLNQASANYGTISSSVYHQYSVLVPVGTTFSGMGLSTPAGTPQFFLDHTTCDTPTPEPATMVLMGSALIALGYAGRKRFAERK